MAKCSLILFNISKKQNFGNILRTADALGVSEILLVGRKKFSTYGNFGTDCGFNRKHFFTLDEAITYLHGQNYKIVGVEVSNNSLPIESKPFFGNTAFLPGNEGTGLTYEQKNKCDYLVYIKQYGHAASINVNVATGIVLHQFAVWAGFSENKIKNQKFVSAQVDEK
ncbi:MAG: hypothetical protein OEZ58_03345 [Gammaproteobacteria bacterium]|nr:hypothetical protein [Gammaproteobacteria bacterium]MDH5727998.1 hypothetical protein [Gammaproteobacteria bacterium]